MADEDARKMTPKQQETLRKTAIRMIFQEGMGKREVVRVIGVCRQQVNKWCRKYEKFGMKGLHARRRGRQKGAKTLLEPWQCAAVIRIITDHTPDQLKLPFVLWTRAAVRDYIEEQYGICLSLNTMGNYLRRWGFTPQKPVVKAYEQSPMAVKKWLEEDYPALAKRAKKEKAIIFWGDETGVTNEIHHGRSYAPKGETPVVKKVGKKIKINMISAVTNKGELRWMSYSSSMTQNKYILFLARLIRSETRKIYFISDNLSVHHGKKVKAWVKEHSEEIELHFIPSYAPELNPDEYLNRDLKTNVHQGRSPRTFDDLKVNLKSFMSMLQKTPARVMKYFNSSKLSYCAEVI